MARHEVINADLLRKTMHRVETVNAFTREGVVQDAIWDQFEWGRRHIRDGEACGTRFCFAGWACIEAGYEIVWIDHPWAPDEQIAWVRYAGRLEEVGTVARRELGLTVDQGAELFGGCNTLADLRSNVAELLELEAAREKAATR